MRRFASESAFITTPGSVLDLTVDQLHLHVGAPWVALYEYSPEGYTRVRQRGGQDLPQIVAADDLALVKLRAHGSEVDLHEAPTGLGRDGYAFPLRARDHLPGVLVVGPRPGEHYAADERELMAYVAHAVGASLFALRAQVTEEQLTVARAQAAASEALLNDARLRESRLLANHDPLRAMGEHRRCPERNVRADELDVFVFEQVRAALLRPQTLLSGQDAVATHRKPSGDELLAAELTRLGRKIEAVSVERRRVADLYQAGFIEQRDLLPRGKELDARRRALETQRETFIRERKELGQKSRLRQRIAGFAEKIVATIDQLNFEQRQQLLRLVVEQVLVKGWQVEIKLRIPLDSPPHPPEERVSSKDSLRSLGIHRGQVLPRQGPSRDLISSSPRSPPRTTDRNPAQCRTRFQA